MNFGKSKLIILLVITAIISVFISCSKSEEEKVSTVSLKEAKEAMAEGDLLMARELYMQAKEDINDLNKLEEIQKTIEELNFKIMFSDIIDDCSQMYVVKPNDVLSKIAKKFGTTVNLIKRINHLNSDIIKPGQKLKVVTCKFSISIDKSQNLLFLEKGDEIFKTYVVSTGKDNSTPVGSFKIVNKLVNPTWFKTGAVIPPDSPENILGTRWLGFNIRGYGIHGTNQPEHLGEQITMGCIRMKNEEVEELFDIVPLGTEVTIVD
jgi:hypothetical protein